MTASHHRHNKAAMLFCLVALAVAMSHKGKKHHEPHSRHNLHPAMEARR